MSVGKLYMLELSPPCRAVLLTAKALGIKLDKVICNLMKGEHLTPEFLKMNPQHSVPTFLDNDGTAMGDSHAIMAYLVGKYGKTDGLYPKDLAKRAAVDQRLHFDGSNVYSLHVDIVRPMWMRENEKNGPTAKQQEAADRMYEILNTFLQGNNWVAGGDCVTIADFSLVTSISSICIVTEMDATKYPNIVKWMKRCEALPYYDEVNRKGQEEYREILVSMLKNKYDFMENKL